MMSNRNRIFARTGSYYVNLRDLGAGQKALIPEDGGRVTTDEELAVELAKQKLQEALDAQKRLARGRAGGPATGGVRQVPRPAEGEGAGAGAGPRVHNARHLPPRPAGRRRGSLRCRPAARGDHAARREGVHRLLGETAERAGRSASPPSGSTSPVCRI